MHKIFTILPCLSILSFAAYSSENSSLAQERKFVQLVRSGHVTARSAAENFPYLDPVDQKYTAESQERFLYNKLHKIPVIERFHKIGNHKLNSLEWHIKDLKFQQYRDPKDHRITLAVKDKKTKRIYWSQQRFEIQDGKTHLVNVFCDSVNQVEYWYDEAQNCWVAEDPRDFKTHAYPTRQNALTQIRKWRPFKSQNALDSFHHPFSYWQDSQQALEPKHEAPSLWKVGFLGYLALFGETVDRFRAKINTWTDPMPQSTGMPFMNALNWGTTLAVLAVSQSRYDPLSPKSFFPTFAISTGLALINGRGAKADILLNIIDKASKAIVTEEERYEKFFQPSTSTQDRPRNRQYDSTEDLYKGGPETICYDLIFKDNKVWLECMFEKKGLSLPGLKLSAFYHPGNKKLGLKSKGVEQKNVFLVPLPEDYDHEKKMIVGEFNFKEGKLFRKFFIHQEIYYRIIEKMNLEIKNENSNSFLSFKWPQGLSLDLVKNIDILFDGKALNFNANQENEFTANLGANIINYGNEHSLEVSMSNEYYQDKYVIFNNERMLLEDHQPEEKEESDSEETINFVVHY